jgi:hypothetical protein
MSVNDLDLRVAQGEAVAAGMAAGAQVKLPAVPRADNIFVVGIVLERARLAVGVNRLAHAVKDAALADRPAAMGALIVPCDQLTIDVEDADLDAVAGNHATLPFRDLPDLCDDEGLHVTFIPVCCF